MNGIEPNTWAQVIVFAAIFLGCLVRTTIPYLRKAKEAVETEPDKPITFKWTYAVTFLIALTESGIAALVALPLFVIDFTLAPLLLFCGGFAWAYMSNDIANRIVG